MIVTRKCGVAVIDAARARYILDDVCVYMCMYMYIYIYIYVCVCMCVCVCVCVYLCVCVCVCVCVHASWELMLCFCSCLDPTGHQKNLASVPYTTRDTIRCTT